MIEAYDLRIENIVYLNNELVILKTVTQNKVKVFGQKIECSLEQLTPVPITPDILKVCNFKKLNLKTKEVYQCYDYRLQKSKGKYFLCGYKGYAKGLSYLHQLQNFHYSITGGFILPDLNALKS